VTKVHSLLRRYLVYRGKVTEAQGISLDLEKRVVMKNGEKVEMTDLEMSIISYLFSRKGEVVSIQDIYENVWGERFFSQSSNTVMVHILNIRKKLEGDAANPKIIRTVWGKGYQLG
jgi:DNA-binding response OmpR family regulator